jgi:hypothetical protein
MVANIVNIFNSTELYSESGLNGKNSVMCILPQQIAFLRWGFCCVAQTCGLPPKPPDAPATQVLGP